MRFNCGPSREDRAKISRREAQDEKMRIALRHKVFAWLPVRIEGEDCVWWEHVNRRALYPQITYDWTALNPFRDRRYYVTVSDWEYTLIQEND